MVDVAIPVEAMASFTSATAPVIDVADDASTRPVVRASKSFKRSAGIVVSVSLIDTSDASFASFAGTVGEPNIVSNSASDSTNDLIDPSARPVTASASPPSALDGLIVSVPDPV